MTKNREEIFIIGLHRTGSTWLQNLVSESFTVDFLPEEVDVSHPWRCTLDRRIHIGKMSDRQTITMLYNNPPYPTYWRCRIPQASKIKPSAYLEKVKSERNHITPQPSKAPEKGFLFLSALMSVIKPMRPSEAPYRIGSKFPFHHSRSSRASSFFPNSKFIFITRDISDVMQSKILHPATKRRARVPLRGFLIKSLTFAIFYIDYIWNMRTIKNFKKKNPNQGLHISYEELKNNPKKELAQIADLLDADCPDDETLSALLSDIKGQPSSHTGQKWSLASGSAKRHSNTARDTSENLFLKVLYKLPRTLRTKI